MKRRWMRRPAGIPIMRLSAGLSKCLILVNLFPLETRTQIEGVRGGWRDIGDMILLLTLTEGKWHFVFRRECLSASPVTSEMWWAKHFFLSRYRLKTCSSFWMICTQLLNFVFENTFNISKISPLSVSIAALPIFIMHLNLTWSEYNGTDLNQ